ncbi:hypothetical protein [Opitutus sp. GAS368]|jgi:hypothetical protein|uniref:hypothetical protein n=1 Tax=Opitutus sp. GAS368 TaxID=1882749 RepID=UPI0012FD6BAC|nr:hypothetical protein [Opitutus sp. GAS368]
MSHLRAARLLALLVLAAGELVRGAAPDNRLAGYWVTPPEAAVSAAFTFSIFGKWTIVAPHLAGAPDTRARYTVESTGNSGTLTLDEPAGKQHQAPGSIHYELQGGELALELSGPAQPTRWRLVKGVPPPPPEMVDLTKSKPAPVKPVRPAEPAKPAPTLGGSWTTEPGVEKQLMLFITRGRTADMAINQQWIKGSDLPVTARSTPYTGTFADGRGQLKLARPEPEGSQIPPVLNFTFEGEALIITVDDGNFAGQYRLVRKGK